MKRVWDAIVVGGGLAGLVAAHRLHREGRKVLLVEADDRVGGAVRTHRTGDWIFEEGPNTVVLRGDLEALIGELGLASEVVETLPEARRRYVWKRGRLHVLPRGPSGLLRSSLFPTSAKLRLLREPWIGRARSDESIADFTRRRLGETWLDVAVGPFASGIYAGDPERLSVRWAMPRLWGLEDRFGSLVRGALKGRKGGHGPPRMITFAGGLDRLTTALAASLAEVRTGARVESIEPGPEFLRVRGTGWQEEAESVVLAVPSGPASRILGSLPGEEPLCERLAAQPQASLAVASYGFRREQVTHSLDGFGFLVPRSESLRLLGCLFPSSFFAGRAPAGHVVLTAFAGGRLDPDFPELDDDEVHASFAADLGASLGIDGDPVVRHLTRWNPALPQYELGHGDLVEAVEDFQRRRPALKLAGSSVGGASVPDSLARGEAAARGILGSPSRGQ